MGEVLGWGLEEREEGERERGKGGGREMGLGGCLFDFAFGFLGFSVFVFVLWFIFDRLLFLFLLVFDLVLGF